MVFAIITVMMEGGSDERAGQRPVHVGRLGGLNEVSEIKALFCYSAVG